MRIIYLLVKVSYLSFNLLTRRIGTFARLFAPLCRPRACTKRPCDICLIRVKDEHNSPGIPAESDDGPFPPVKCAFLGR